MFESLAGLMQKAWRPGGEGSRLTGPSSDALLPQTARNPTRIEDPTAPIRVPLNWLPTPEPASPTDGKARATR